MDSFKIIWRGSEIGNYENIVFDMWYIEGDWISNNSISANEFQATASKLDAKKVMNDLKCGMKIFLHDNSLTNPPVLAIVYSLDKKFLFVRTVNEKEAIKWVEDNVD